MISNSISVSWNPIDCIEQNGLITNYMTEFRQMQNAFLPRLIDTTNFTARGLTPSTHYSFRVAGVNEEGQGPFSNILIARTAGKLAVISSMYKLWSIVFIKIQWCALDY